MLSYFCRWGAEVFFFFLFFYCCLWWQGNRVTLVTQVHIPVQNLKWMGIVNFVCDWLTAQSSTWWQICRFCWDLMDKRQFMPLIFFKGMLILFFRILFVVIHIFNVLIMLFDQANFLSVRFSCETYCCLFCTDYLLISPSNFGALDRLLPRTRILRSFSL